GLTMFHMAFHLPHFAWRPSLRRDHRLCGEEPLRQTRDVSFLDWKNAERSGYLHEVQTSFVLAGWNDYLWTSYCFDDVYFEAWKDREFLFSGRKGILTPGNRTDPIRRGRPIADDAFQNPREYFLAVLRIRVMHVRNEW